jgi:lipopolysaccharide export system permease protein
LVPWSVEQARALRNDLRYTYQEKTGHGDTAGLVTNLVYNNNAGHRHWFFNSFQDTTYLGTGIHVYELDDRGHDVRHLEALTGYFDKDAGHWVLEKGFELLFDPVSKQPARKLYFEKRDFKELTDSPSMMLALNQRPDNLSLGELRTVLAVAPPGDNPAMSAYAVGYYGILAEPFVCLIIVGLAVPFAVAGVRVNPMVGVSKSVGLFFAYYVVSTVSTHLGNQRLLPALIAAWLPIAVMLAVATWFFARAE